ncbi:Maf-like protein [Clostridium cellulovorans]|uniref:dTTP/UTP pyrophosphatase n=1 Tax=Clostridium cellulovorans (strain ATCC 35296 / DSM 3052 / OCM 3 / 743B) TaxID=573061 RepID=D9SS20_CLOC7|nr:Maf-like protein [Clostridium cellulovorans]ADL52467.1 maf protein [Clostridium cellulovorans 743B]
MKFVLASASPRRKELINRVLQNVEIIPSKFDENSIEYNGDVVAYVQELALNKALDVLKDCSGEYIIIGCDTVVYNNGKILEKPKNEDEAFAMLKSLSGAEHSVFSAVAIVNSKTNNVVRFHEESKVRFSELTDEEILSYIETKEPFDKAGAYGIQGYGGLFVEAINGCYYNVVGLPINKLYKTLRAMGVNSKGEL